MITRKWVFLAATLAPLLLSGCVITGTTYVREPGYYREGVAIGNPPPPAYYPPGQPLVVGQPPPLDRQALTVVSEPPAPLREVIPERPGRGFVWTPGYWVRDRDGDRWVWVHGMWQRPPYPGARWERPHWDRYGDEFRFSIGAWH